MTSVPAPFYASNFRTRHFDIWLVSLALMVISQASGMAATFSAQSEAIPFEQSDGTTLKLDTLVLIPDQPGRHPLAVFSHGSPRNAADRSIMSPNGWTALGNWFVARGFAVAIP